MCLGWVLVGIPEGANRLEFRDLGVFEPRTRESRIAQNPKTLEKVQVPAKRSVKFKMGRLVRARLIGGNSTPSPA